jgi:nucleotide-binding universal stress UspA family protein
VQERAGGIKKGALSIINSHNSPEVSMRAIKTILFPTDFSGSSAVAWKHALLHAKQHKARLVLVHVVHRMPQDYQFLIVGMTPHQIYESLKRRAEQKLERMAKEARKKRITCDVVIRDGQPFVQIIRCARERKADIIVMGSRGHTGLKQVLLGSVAERVVSEAPCSVLIVRQPARKS